MHPEKPKRKHASPNKQRLSVISMVLVVLIGIPVSLVIFSRSAGDTVLDTLLIGVILCCFLYLLYQSVEWLLYTLLNDSQTEPPVYQPSPDTNDVANLQKPLL